MVMFQKLTLALLVAIASGAPTMDKHLQSLQAKTDKIASSIHEKTSLDAKEDCIDSDSQQATKHDIEQATGVSYWCSRGHCSSWKTEHCMRSCKGCTMTAGPAGPMVPTSMTDKCLEMHLGNHKFWPHSCSGSSQQQLYFEDGLRGTSINAPARIKNKKGNKCLDYHTGHGMLYWSNCHHGVNMYWYFEGGQLKSMYQVGGHVAAGSKCAKVDAERQLVQGVDCDDNDDAQKFTWDRT